VKQRKHKIPLHLKLLRFKNSDFIGSVNNIFSYLSPQKKYEGIPGKILIFRNDRIGDAVVTLPIIRNIKLNYPQIKIDVLVSLRNKFVFEDFKYVDEIIDYDRQLDDLHIIYKIPVIGGILQFVVFIVIPYLKSHEIRDKIEYLHRKKYDVAVDLVGLKRNILLSKLISRYSIGPKSLGTYFLYDYYCDSNWVSAKDTVFMTQKIENIIKKSLGLDLKISDTTLPLIEIEKGKSDKKKYEIVFHIGSTGLRKLSFNKEKDIITSFSDLNILVINSKEDEDFIELKKHFAGKNNIEFKIFNSLKDIIPECVNSRLLICYDGGQAHYLSQYVRSLVIFGPGSVNLWRPYEFSEYSLLKSDSNGCLAVISSGKFKHISVYYPVWCRPCFDVGCEEKVCLKNIEPDFLTGIIKEYGLKND
jgi:ADP-heptose:LPS heptosyltransferase